MAVHHSIPAIILAMVGLTLTSIGVILIVVDWEKDMNDKVNHILGLVAVSMGAFVTVLGILAACRLDVVCPKKPKVAPERQMTQPNLESNSDFGPAQLMYYNSDTVPVHMAKTDFPSVERRTKLTSAVMPSLEEFSLPGSPSPEPQQQDHLNVLPSAAGRTHHSTPSYSSFKGDYLPEDDSTPGEHPPSYIEVMTIH